MSTANITATQAPVTTIREIGQHEGQAVTIRGWLYNLRESGKMLFPIFRDGTGLDSGRGGEERGSPEMFERVKKLTQESSVIVTGKVRADKRAPGGYEIDVSDVEVVQPVPESDPYPITPKEHGVDFLMDHRHLWMRTPRQAAILRVRARDHQGGARLLRRARLHPRPTRPSSRRRPARAPPRCSRSSTSTTQAYLTQSGQLYNEATAMALGKVYCFGPTFRAEKSKTRRHLTEFWMVEPEMAYATLDDVMELAEEFVTFIVERVLERRRAELKTLGRDVAQAREDRDALPAHHLRRSGEDAAGGHAKGELENRFEWGGDFGAPDETYLSSKFDRPVMVHRYPAAVKAFYMEPDPQRPEVALCVDVLAPEGYGEIIGGAQRIGSLRPAAQAHRGAQPAGGGLRVVSRPAPVRQRAARRLRHGHRARGGLDLRPRARARNHPVPAHADTGSIREFHRRDAEDAEMSEDQKLDAITRKIIGAAINVHRALGPGLLESAYETCLAFELQQLGLKVERQKPLPVRYSGITLDCGYRLDLVVEDCVIVEIKATEGLLPSTKPSYCHTCASLA